MLPQLLPAIATGRPPPPQKKTLRRLLPYVLWCQFSKATYSGIRFMRLLGVGVYEGVLPEGDPRAFLLVIAT